MKNKYVVYVFIGYTDDYGCLKYDKLKAGVYEDEEDAIIRAYEIRHMCYNIKIEEE